GEGGNSFHCLPRSDLRRLPGYCSIHIACGRRSLRVFVRRPDSTSPPTGFLTVATASPRYSISYRNCFVAVDEPTNAVIAMANIFPTDLLKKENSAALPLQRRSHIRPMLELQDWGSMFLNALAVSERYRCHGIGARLLDWAEDRSRQAGFDRLSLHCWTDNTAAVNFYRARGFVALAVADILYDARLRHFGGSVLMQRKISPAAYPSGHHRPLLS